MASPAQQPARLPLITCPNCKSSQVRYSRKASFQDELRGLFGRRPYRCEGCKNRFFAPPVLRKLTREELRKERQEQLIRAGLAALVVTAGGLGILIPLFSSLGESPLSTPNQEVSAPKISLPKLP